APMRQRLRGCQHPYVHFACLVSPSRKRCVTSPTPPRGSWVVRRRTDPPWGDLIAAFCDWIAIPALAEIETVSFRQKVTPDARLIKKRTNHIHPDIASNS